jgi:hypothetical protein
VLGTIGGDPMAMPLAHGVPASMRKTARRTTPLPSCVASSVAACCQSQVVARSDVVEEPGEGAAAHAPPDFPRGGVLVR